MKTDKYAVHYDDLRQRVYLIVGDMGLPFSIKDSNKIIDSIRTYEVRKKLMESPNRIAAGSYMINSVGIRFDYYGHPVSLILGKEGLIELADKIADCVAMYNLRLSNREDNLERQL